jgi:hypothetical protein
MGYKNTTDKKYGNVKIGATWDVDMKPWSPMISLKFKVKPTPKAVDSFNGDLSEFHQQLTAIFGTKSLAKQVEPLVPQGWRLHMVVYAYDHHPTQINFTKQSAMQVDVWVIASNQYEEANDWKGLKKAVEQLAPKLAKIPAFTKYGDLLDIKA